MKTAILHTLIAVVVGGSAPRALCDFNSLWVFGDGVCTGTNGPGGANYHENRYCNGRVWVELLAEWQGMSFDVADFSQNISYYGHDSFALVENVGTFTAPPDVEAALFVVWANDADFVRFTRIDDPPSPTYGPANLPIWEALIAESIAKHDEAVRALHAKGARTIVMPLAVDLAQTPDYNLSPTNEDFIRQRTIEYNSALVSAMENLDATLPGLTIHLPDTFAFLDDVLANPANYGMVNPGIDAITDLGTPALDGVGADYVFWDFLHPTAKVQMHLAELVQQMISPVRIEAVTPVGADIALNLENIPIGRGGFVDGSAMLTDGWAEDATVPANAASETIVLPRTDAKRFFQARFPLEWSWP